MLSRWLAASAVKYPAFSNLAIGSLPVTVAGSLSLTGAVLLRATTPATIASKQVLIGASNSTTTNDFFEIGIDTDFRIYLQRSVAGSLRTVKAVTVLDASTEYTIAIVFDGIDYLIRINGAEENPLTIETYAVAAGWFGSVASGDSLRIGQTLTSAGSQRAFLGTISAAEIYTMDIT